MAAQANSKTFQVAEEIEGERIETNDYFFDKLGDGVHVMSDGAIFDVQNPPAKPLAVSERFGLIFAAHSSGELIIIALAWLRLLSNSLPFSQFSFAHGIRVLRCEDQGRNSLGQGD